MFNWKPNEDKLESLKKELQDQREMVYDTRKIIVESQSKWERDRADLWKAIKDTQEQLSKPVPPPNLTALEQKLAVLDTWRAQLHTLLVERGNTGKEKLTRTGNALAKFYGR